MRTRISSSKYTCLPTCQKSTSDQLVWMKGKAGKFFQHEWLSHPKWYDDHTKFWWLDYVENDGMYCLLCKKHGNKGMRCRKLVLRTIKDHANSKRHRQCQNVELLSRSSAFQRDLDRRKQVEISLVQRVFEMVYWMMKEEIANVKFDSLLKVTERVGVSDFQLFTLCKTFC